MQNLVSLSLFLCLLLPPSLSIAQAAVDNLDSFQWNNRIVLIKTDAQTDSVLDSVREATPEIFDRDILWFVFSNTVTHTNYPNELAGSFVDNIVARYFDNNDTGVVLIGKDGGVKNRSIELNLSEIFGLIDGMPMRRAEMTKAAD
jgi:hypothetical protein